MNNPFTKNPEWTASQNTILNSEPGIIVNGCAGSGKTLLACHLAIRHSIEKKTAIIVFTKSLKTFIKDYLKKFSATNITVYHKSKWDHSNTSGDYDIIIVDEFQDFAIKEITELKKTARIGLYLFGDIHQQIYTKNIRKEPTLSLHELQSSTGFALLELNENFRVSEENKNFIRSMFPRHSLISSNFTTSIKPQILRFETAAEEVRWLSDFLKANTEFHNIGILLKLNDSFEAIYPSSRKYRKEKIMGVLELVDFLSSQGINVTYKHHFEDYLDFSKDRNINVMTIHSSKGLQFDCVIIPFSNYGNKFEEVKNLSYVALTRSSGQVLISYSGLINSEYVQRIPKSFYEGMILNKTDHENVPMEVIVPQIMGAKANEWKEFVTGCKFYKD